MSTKLPSVITFEDQQIASITETFRLEDGRYDMRLISKGMVEEFVIKYFPATALAIAAAEKKGDIPLKFNMSLLCRSIIFEEYTKIGKNRKRGNVRHLFYTNIIYLLTQELKVTNISSLNTILGRAWKELIESGLVTYEGLNISSAKDKFSQSFARHSPFSNYIICVEKESLLKDLSWTAEIFRTTIIAAGGQPSTATIRAFVRSLALEKADLNKPFYLLVITDLDPAGWYIQETFANQIEKSIKYYNNGKGEVIVLRLFLTLNQITDNIISDFAISARDKEAKTKKAIKASKTKVRKYKEKLGDQWERLFIDKQMMKIELEAIDASLMEEKIAEDLLELIDDHSLILIPEIMDELEKQRENVIQDFFDSYKEDEIDSIIDDYLKPIKKSKEELKSEHSKIKNKIRNDYRIIENDTNNTRYFIKHEIDNLIESIINRYEEKANELVEDELLEIKEHKEEIESLQNQISEYEELIETLEEEIEEKIEEKFIFYNNEIEEFKDNRKEIHKHLETKRNLFLDPARIIRDVAIVKIESDWKIFEKKLTDFKSQQKGKFGSYLRSVEKHFQDSLNSEKIPVFFDEVEFDPNVQIQMSYLLTNPKLLLDENKSCLEHPKPAFRESCLLQNALDSDNFENTKRNPDLSNFRNAFSESLEKALKGLMNKKLKPIPIELDSVVDLPEEYNTELENLIQEIRDKIKKDKIYSLLNYHPEDLEEKEKEEEEEK